MQNTLRRTMCLGIVGLSVLASVARADDKKDEKKESAKSTAKLSFKRAWEVEVPADTMQIGVADVMGDKKFHLLTLGKDGVLTIHDVSGDKPKEAGKVELGKTADSFIVGSFLMDKPAIIVIEGAYFVRGKDGTYTQTPQNILRPVNGVVRPYDKSETVFSAGVNQKPIEFVFSEKGDKIEVKEQDRIAVGLLGGTYQIVTVRIPKKDASAGPLPEGVKLGGFNVFIDKAGETASLLTLFVEGEKQSLCLYDFKQLSTSGVNPDGIKPIWTGPQISGKVLDFIVGTNPKDAKQTGAFVLTESKDDAKKHTVTFFAKE